MHQDKVNEIIKAQELKYKQIYDRFEIGDHVELMSSSYEDTLPVGAEGIVLDKSYSKHGCDLRVDFEGYVTWLDAVDLA